MKPAAVLACAFALSACGGAAKEPASPGGEHHEEKPTAAGDVKAPGEAKPGDKSRCTVTGEELDVTADTPHSEYNGKTYYFCCPGCKKKFDADPSKFTKS